MLRAEVDVELADIGLGHRSALSREVVLLAISE
jgi:hypothetical protein